MICMRETLDGSTPLANFLLESETAEV